MTLSILKARFGARQTLQAGKGGMNQDTIVIKFVESIVTSASHNSTTKFADCNWKCSWIPENQLLCSPQSLFNHSPLFLFRLTCRF